MYSFNATQRWRLRRDPDNPDLYCVLCVTRRVESGQHLFWIVILPRSFGSGLLTFYNNAQETRGFQESHMLFWDHGFPLESNPVKNGGISFEVPFSGKSGPIEMPDCSTQKAVVTLSQLLLAEHG
jgi:hypothetical protein